MLASGPQTEHGTPLHSPCRGRRVAAEWPGTWGALHLDSAEAYHDDCAGDHHYSWRLARIGRVAGQLALAFPLAAVRPILKASLVFTLGSTMALSIAGIMVLGYAASLWDDTSSFSRHVAQEGQRAAYTITSGSQQLLGRRPTREGDSDAHISARDRSASKGKASKGRAKAAGKSKDKDNDQDDGQDKDERRPSYGSADSSPLLSEAKPASPSRAHGGSWRKHVTMPRQLRDLFTPGPVDPDQPGAGTGESSDQSSSSTRARRKAVNVNEKRDEAMPAPSSAASGSSWALMLSGIMLAVLISLALQAGHILASVRSIFAATVNLSSDPHPPNKGPSSVQPWAPPRPTSSAAKPAHLPATPRLAGLSHPRAPPSRGTKNVRPPPTNPRHLSALPA